MTQQYLAGELSVLLSHVQGVTTTEAARCAARSLRNAAETAPVQALGGVTVRALALAEGLCWDSLNCGDTAAFSRQATVCAELHEFGICAGLLQSATVASDDVPRQLTDAEFEEIKKYGGE